MKKGKKLVIAIIVAILFSTSVLADDVNISSTPQTAASAVSGTQEIILNQPSNGSKIPAPAANGAAPTAGVPTATFFPQRSVDDQLIKLTKFLQESTGGKEKAVQYLDESQSFGAKSIQGDVENTDGDKIAKISFQPGPDALVYVHPNEVSKIETFNQTITDFRAFNTMNASQKHILVGTMTVSAEGPYTNVTSPEVLFGAAKAFFMNKVGFDGFDSVTFLYLPDMGTVFGNGTSGEGDGWSISPSISFAGGVTLGGLGSYGQAQARSVPTYVTTIKVYIITESIDGHALVKMAQDLNKIIQTQSLKK